MREQDLSIPGPAGNLESLLVQPDGWTEQDPIAICCHPHPLHGGTMHNKVVTILAKSFHQLGAASVRFNFRGVGQSEGQFAQGEGEQSDLLAVVHWLQQQYPSAPIWLSGFSFGAYVALMAHSSIQPMRLLLIAPAVNMYPQMQDIQVQTKDWLLVQGGRDEVVPPQAVADWLKRQMKKPRLIWMEEAGHYFHGQLTRLQERITASWRRKE